MTPLKRLSLKFFVVAALLMSSAVLFNTTKASMMSCAACREAVNSDIGLCYQLQAQATDECGVSWVIDPCEVTPAAVCISKCTCN
jgi:hypothetical protein